MGVNYIIEKANRCLHLGKKCADIKAVVLGCWGDLLVTVLVK